MKIFDAIMYGNIRLGGSPCLVVMFKKSWVWIPAPDAAYLDDPFFPYFWSKNCNCVWKDQKWTEKMPELTHIFLLYAVWPDAEIKVAQFLP